LGDFYPERSGCVLRNGAITVAAFYFKNNLKKEKIDFRKSYSLGKSTF